MKNWLNKSLIFFVASLALMSCEKDEERLVIKPGTSPVLTSSATEAVLNKEEAGNTALMLSWTPADYGYQAAVEYVLQYDMAGDNFTDPMEMALSADTYELELTEAELNAMAAKLKMSPEVPADMEMRIMTSVSPLVESTYSNPVTVNVTPYLDIIDYASLYVPGQYQGWAPDRAPKISSIDDNGIYEGYVYMGVADGFKFTSEQNWGGKNYGDGGAGKLSDDGGAGNLTVAEPGLYLLKANTNALTWSATKMNWGLTGSATPNGWASDTAPDHNLVYDEEEDYLSVTLPLTVGEIKFRANDGWDLNYGDSNSDGFVDAGGDNIKVEEAGTYKIILDLSIPGYYSYSLVKQ